MSRLRRAIQGVGILWARLVEHGCWPTTLWAADHAVRIITGANIRAVSQITDRLHVGGQYNRSGWPRLAARGITAVVNLRIEFDDGEAGIAPDRYLYLPTVDDHPPSLAHLRQGVAFMTEEIERGGGVFVHCGSGVGRAPTMAAAYLVGAGKTVDEAWQMIREKRPFVRPRPEQVAQVERFAAGTQTNADGR